MCYSVQPNEIAGFIALLDAANFYSQEKKEKEKWLERFPVLKNTEFEALVDYIRDEGQSAKGHPLRRLTQMFLPQIHSLDDLKKCITQSRPEEANRVNSMIDSVYPVYQKFYKKNEQKIQDVAEQVTELLNKIEEKHPSLEKVSHFFNSGYQHKDEKITVYVFPTSLNGFRGQNFHTVQKGQTYSDERLFLQEDQQWIALGADILDGTPPPDIGQISSIIYHEKVHGLFHDTGAEKWLNDYLTQDNPIIQKMKEFPELKRNPNVSGKSEAEMMINESLTSAFQGILEKQVRRKVPEVLYENHVINTMAHQMIPILENALQKGKTFGAELMKEFESEFIKAIPQMSHHTRLSEGRKKGNNDFRNQMNIPSEKENRSPTKLWRREGDSNPR